MVRKCCVPQCKSDIKFIPSHRLPKNLQKAKIWLEAIKRTDLINASSQTLNNLRICTLHFSDDCIVSYAARRNLKDCALPTLQLPSIVNEQAETSTTISNFENVDIHHPVVMPIPKCKQVNIQSSLSNQVCRKKLRQAKKLLYKKKIKICKQRKEINKFRKKNKWEEITTDFSSVQRIFLDVIKMNLKRKPEVYFSYYFIIDLVYTNDLLY
ncbi:hypothetical protein ALC62_11522 [Cyphomyrmex costatus]|uniref:THAP-type domain-containing protein n=1 Tax=Cyphomyrmex costatus TaxID=456900 RepID=A0A151ICH8_9HYME|nr:hypothetical protein ALC62_11522 [Cyphomyrmex costatus]